MNIKNLNKAEVLAALYNRAIPLERSVYFSRHEPMTPEKAQMLLDLGHTSFSELEGRALSVDLKKEEVDTRLYNRNNGNNAAENAIEWLVNSKK